MVRVLICIILVAFAAPRFVLADGRGDYRAHCAACHAASPKGYPDWERAKALNVDLKRLALSTSQMDKAEMTAVVEKGKGTMPGYDGTLTKVQIAAIVDYILESIKK
jgi:mono/diheme cytochrome c family protein